MLRLYLGYLLRRRANLEWYFEGGRTRTGKLRPPKMGVLKWLVDAFRANGADAGDVLPRAGRDRLRPAARGLRAVARGVRRHQDPREPDLGGALRPRPGRVAAAARTCASARRSRCATRSRRPPPGPARPRPAEVVPRVAFEVAHRINAATPITPGGAGDLRAARQRRPGDDPAGDAGRPRAAGGLRTQAPAAADRRRRPRPARGPAQGAAHPGPRGRRRGVRRRPRARLRRSRPGRAHEAGFYRNTVTHYFITRAIARGRRRADLRGRRRATSPRPPGSTPWPCATC